MVRQVPLDAVLTLRSVVLRDSRIPPEACKWPEDESPGSVHVAYQDADGIQCIASIYPIGMPGMAAGGYQLRGMAAAPGKTGLGYGSSVLKEAIRIAGQRGATYLWCNARTGAVAFYQRHGFVTSGEEFSISGVGPHYRMILPSLP